MIGRARRAPVAAGLRWCSVTGDLSTGGAAPSVFPALEALLPRVAKPVQYVGGELNARAKPWDAVQVRWALMYPDAYEVGLPNQGIQILYEILNERPDALAERCYAVWPDLEALMREARVPAFTVDAHRPLGAFDALGVSFATELGYTNLLTALDLAGIPLHATDRDEHHPIVVAGGHAAFNPEPIADFVDVAAIGDGEEVVGDITDVVRDWKAAGRPGGRPELLLRLAEVQGCYVPSLYAVSYGPDGAIAEVLPAGPRVPRTVQKRTTVDLDSWPYPKTPLVPMAETVHERASVEIFRGCTRGCRFCQAGMITRPVRERSLRGIGEMVDSAVRASGFDEVGLLSLSSADHSEIAEITKGLADRYEGTNTSLSLPSTRVDAFNIDLANEISRNGRRSGLTFAPEGGSERIRRVINKMVSEDDLIRTVSEAFAQGWRQVKLYFMCGLPTEEDDDVVQIADMAHNVIRAGRAASGRNDVRCTISIGGFVPKPHTPFQWAAQAHPDVVDARLRKLREAVNADRKLGRNVGMRYHDGQPSLIEGLLARGDRRVGRVIERVWREGGRFDGWSEHFSYQRWVDACAAELPPLGVSLDWFTTRERDRAEVLPWDHLDSGLERDWLWDDWQDALAGREQDDCRWTPCFDCGVCPSTGTDIEVGPSGTTLLPLTAVNTRSGRFRTSTGWLSRTSSYGWPTSATRPPSPGCAAPGSRNAPGGPVDDPGFEAAFAQWWRLELPRRTFWLAEAGSGRSGWTPVGSINVVEIVHMPRPGSRRRPDRACRQRVRAQRVRRPRCRGGPAGPRGAARAGAAIPAPGSGPYGQQRVVLHARGVPAGGGVAAGARPDGAARPRSGTGHGSPGAA